MPYESVSGDITMALAGEALITRSLRPFREPNYLRLLELIRGADVSFVNLEMIFHDFEGSPHEQSKGTYMRAAPELAEDVKWMGFDIVSSAMNHAFDYLTEGVMVNLANLRRAGLVSAGTGKNLSMARSPAYFDSVGGRVALVAATDHINVPGGRAGEARYDNNGRPGANLLRVETVYNADDETFGQLAAIDEKLGFSALRGHVKSGRFPGEKFEDTADRLYFGPSLEPPTLVVQRSDEPGSTTYVDADDVEENMRFVRDARYMADWVLFSLHGGYNGKTTDDPAAHAIEIAHAAIDNGADVVIGHGTHRDKGIEIYRGKPIFYGVGNLLLQNDTVVSQPQDAYARFGLDPSTTPGEFYEMRSKGGTIGQDIRPVSWQSILPICRWEARELKSIELHPLDLGIGLPLGQRGRPVIAEGDVADAVIGRMQKISEQFGTKIEYRGGIGVIEVG